MEKELPIFFYSCEQINFILNKCINESNESKTNDNYCIIAAFKWYEFYCQRKIIKK
jgi:hypothetical protein